MFDTLSSVVQMAVIHGFKVGIIAGALGALLLVVAHLLGLDVRKPLVPIGVAVIVLVAMVPISAVIFVPA